MSILDIFRGATAATPAAAQAATPAAAPQPAAAATPDANAAQQAGVSPMDSFKDLWQPVAKVEGNEPQPLFNVDAAKISEAASKANFAAGVSPETVAAALKGDASAFSLAINQASQQAFAQATIASTKLIEQALASHGKNQEANISGLVKRNMVADSLATNPLYQHEATRPLLNALEAQLSAKHPNATAAQITEHAQRYISEFAQIASGKPQPTAEETAKSKADNQWAGWDE